MTQTPHTPTDAAASAQDEETRAAWRALFALMLGFFMIMIDTTIVSVSIPSIMRGLETDVTGVMWVSSAYLLTYAIPLLVTGRLGDRFGPRRLYLIGMLVFTLSSLWCGLSGSIGSLVAARAVQGVGAALMSPQSMSVITRIFPPQRRGGAMGMWGATASVAGLAGPLLGGLLVDSVGWEWIFFVNVPVGIIGMAAVWKWVPKLETHAHSFDWVGVLLSGLGLSLMVFGLQEGQTKSWPAWIILMILAGVVVMGLFVWQQSRGVREPLMPLELFGNRNFTVANAAIFLMGGIVVAFSFPLMLYLQQARGLSPTRAALISLPAAVVSFVTAPVIGKMTNTRSTRPFAVFGFAVYAAVLFSQAELMRTGVSVYWMLLPAAFMGLSGSCIWGPLSMSATRDLPPRWAGAGSGVYNATRQLGSVLGSAAIATIIEWQSTSGGSGAGQASEASTVDVSQIPAAAQAMATAMRHSTWFPAGAAVLAGLVCLFLVKPAFLREAEARARGEQAGAVPAGGEQPTAAPEPPVAAEPGGAPVPVATTGGATAAAVAAQGADARRPGADLPQARHAAAQDTSATQDPYGPADVPDPAAQQPSTRAGAPGPSARRADEDAPVVPRRALPEDGDRRGGSR